MHMCFGSEGCPLQKHSPAHLPKPLQRHAKARTEEEVPHLGIMLPLKEALRVHVPYYYVLRPKSPYIGSTLRPKYSIIGYMDP